MKLTAQIIQSDADTLARLHAELLRTLPFRDCGIKEKYLQLKAARNAYWEHASPLDKLWSDQFTKLVRQGDRESIDELITFLEIDPFYHRSGYLKEHLTKIIKQAPRTSRDNRRLRRVIWNHLAGPNRREFHYYRRLAKQVADQDFINALNQISPEIDCRAKGKYSNLFNYLTNQTS